MSLGKDLIDGELQDGETLSVTIKVTHQPPEDTAEVDAVEMALREMLVAKNLLPLSDSADLAGYPGLMSQG